MGKQFEQLNTSHISFIEAQRVFFVGTAAETGHVNVSPKGGDSLRVLSENRIAWLNLTGSGNESAAHVQLLPRMTLMFCAFEGPPLILRTYGDATVFHQGDPEWGELITRFPDYTGRRQIFVQDISLVQSSCGMSVPFYDFKEDRTALTEWADKQGREGIEAYWEKKNQQTLNGFNTHIVEASGLALPRRQK